MDCRPVAWISTVSCHDRQRSRKWRWYLLRGVSGAIFGYFEPGFFRRIFSSL